MSHFFYGFSSIFPFVYIFPAAVAQISVYHALTKRSLAVDTRPDLR